MTNPDQETVLRAMEDARRILGEYIANVEQANMAPAVILTIVLGVHL